MARFLLAAHSFAGHVVPMTGLARALIARGHKVLCYTGTRYEAQVTEAGCDFVPFRQAPDYDETKLDETFPHLRDGHSPTAILTNFRDIFFGTAPAQARDLVELQQRHQADALIAENTCFGAALAHDLLSIPFGSASLSLLPLSTAAGPHPGLGFKPSRGPLGRARDAALRTVLELTADRLMLQWHNRTRADLGLPPTTRSGLGGLLSEQLVLAQGVPDLEPPRPAMPDHVHFVGDLAAGARGGPSDDVPDWLTRLPGDRPVVHVTEGTFRDRNSLVARTAGALARETTVVVGGRHRAGTLPPDVIDVGWVPYDLLLPRVDLFISNGGYGGVVAALSHGIPILIVPGDEDKPLIARRVAWSGAGRFLSPRRATPDRLRTAAFDLLTDKRYAQRAAQIAQQMAQAGGPHRAAELAERLLR